MSEPKPSQLSAGLLEKARIAVRGLASLFGRKDAPPVEGLTDHGTTVISVDTL